MLKTFVLIALAASISACATVQQTTVRTKDNYQKVWNACVDVVADVQYSVSSTDPTSGLIIADQAVLGGHGQVSRLNIRLFKALTGTDVTVKFIPPPGTIGGGGTAERYVTALKQRIPDLESVIITKPQERTVSQPDENKQIIPDMKPVVIAKPLEQNVSQPVKNISETDSSSKGSTTTSATMFVSVDKGKLRQKASTKSAVIRNLKKGDEVQVLKQKDGWYLIELAGGESGWCHNSVISQAVR